MAHFQPEISETMLQKVDVILNKANQGTQAGCHAGIKIDKYPEYGTYHISCVFKGIDVNDKSFEIEPIEVNGFFIDQDFISSYMDNIEIKITIRAIEFLTMFEGYKDLKCDVIIRYADYKTGEVVGVDIEGEPAYTLTDLKVIFKDKQDIMKKLPKKTVIPDTKEEFGIEQQDMVMSDVALQLMTESAYKLRINTFSFQMTMSTVKDAILFIAHSCDISTISLVEPDNDKEYYNLFIPPMCTFEGALIHLQEYYGIYHDGLGFYFTNDILYIYPRYKVPPSLPICPKQDIPYLYFIGGMKYPNLEINHAVDTDNNTHIVINATNSSRDLVDVGVEQFGTGTIIMDADRVIDLWRSVGENVAPTNMSFGKLDIHRTPNVILNILKECEKKSLGISTDTKIVKYEFNEANTFKCNVPLQSYKRTLVTTSWDNAVIDTFKPGYRIKWNYDGEDPTRRDPEDNIAKSYMFTTRDGCIDSVVYLFKRYVKHGSNILFRCVAPIRLSMEMDPIDDTDSKDINSDIDEANANKAMGEGSAYQLSETRGPTRNGPCIYSSAHFMWNTDSDLLTPHFRWVKAYIIREGRAPIKVDMPHMSKDDDILLADYERILKETRNTQANKTLVKTPSIF